MLYTEDIIKIRFLFNIFDENVLLKTKWKNIVILACRRIVYFDIWNEYKFSKNTMISNNVI